MPDDQIGGPGLVHELTRFLKYPQLELSNNLSQNSMRPLAPGTPQVDSHWQPARQAEDCCDSLRGGKPPAVDARYTITGHNLPGMADAPIQKLPALTRVTLDQPTRIEPRCRSPLTANQGTY